MDYLPVLIMLLLASLLAFGILVASALVGPKKYHMGKLDPYESGVPLKDTSRKSFAIKFYLIAILFVLFDVEVVYFYPWAVVFRKLKLFGLVEMGVFVAILLVGYIYLWKRGALEWE